MSPYSELTSIRLGYGLSPLVPAPPDPKALLASIVRAGSGGIVTTTEVRDLQLRYLDMRHLQRGGDADAEYEIRAIRRSAHHAHALAVQRRFVRAVDDPGGLGERLVQFWADHFTISGGTSFRNLMTAAFVDEAIRPNLNGRFADLMFAAETHPGMQLYLDQNKSIGPDSPFADNRRGTSLVGLNENLAREMIELHSLGAGANYTQDDVRQLAELLTGLVYSPRSKAVFRSARAERGSETVLGHSYGSNSPAKLSDIRAVIEDLARHPHTAHHLARKIAVHFVADDPPQGLVNRLAEAYGTGGDLPAVYAVLATAPELETYFRRKLRQPFDFVVASLRALGMTGPKITNLSRQQMNQWILTPMTGMGQDWGRPRGPDGWPEAAKDWATPQGLAARINWSMRVPSLLIAKLPDPRRFLEDALGDTASEPLRWAVPRAESSRDGIAVILASADFNRR